MEDFKISNLFFFFSKFNSQKQLATNPKRERSEPENKLKMLEENLVRKEILQQNL